MAGMRLVGNLCLFLAAAVWGGMYVVSKFTLGYIPPLSLLVLRYVLGAAGLFALMAVLPGKRAARDDLPQLALLGLIGLTVSVGAQFIGTRLSSAHHGALITSSSPAFIVLFAAWLLRERPSPRGLLALVLAGLGVAFVIGPGQGADHNTVAGDLWLLLAGLTWALYTVLAKRATARLPSLTVTAWATLFGLLFTLPLALALEPGGLSMSGLPPAVWWGVLYLGLVSTAGAFYLWNLGFELSPAPAASGALWFFAQPVVGSALGWAVLGERLGPGFFAGGALIVAGVALASLDEALPGAIARAGGARGRAP